MTSNSSTCRRILAAAAMLALGSSSALAQSCASAPTPVRDLQIERYYADAEGTKIDPALKAATDAAVEPLVAFMREVVRNADAAVTSARPDQRAASAHCALDWLSAWAKGDAWLGSRITQQGEYQRKWDLGGAALAYVKVKSFATAEQRRLIEGWLVRVAVAARAFFDNPSRKRNNHWYWLALGLGGVSLATGDERWWSMAREMARDAARDIRPDGSLPMELERGERALHYHAFAAMPLVVLAEIAAARGEDFYAFDNGALHRLIALTRAGLDDPARFDKLAGVRQKVVSSTPGAAWLPIYARRFPDRLPPPLPAMRMADRRLGGDAQALLDTISSRRK